MKELRRKLRNGIITPPEKFGVKDIAWKGGINYVEMNLMPESVKWWLSCMGFLKLLFVNDLLADEDETISRTIIEDWYKKNPLGSCVFPRAWDGHAVALRAEVFVEVSKRSRDKEYLSNILKEHLCFLLDEKNFQGNWNHGVDQANALIRLAKFMQCEESEKIGVRRLEEALDALVDHQGVTIEQSIHYQLYNYKQIKKCIGVLMELDLKNKNEFFFSLLERKELMKTFLAHATRPDGNYLEIGDTPTQLAEALPKSDAEYAATLGKCGFPPLEKVKVYDAGYIFGRSGWGETRRFQDESHYAVRFGPSRIVHGHNDHGSILYYTNGREVLRDSGFHGYTADATRQFLRLIEAHNTVSISTPSMKFKGCETKLLSSQMNGGWQKFTLLSHPYDGVSHKRSIVFSRSPETIVIVDEVSSATEVTASQRWHFGDSFELRKLNDTTVESKDKLMEMRQLYSFEDLKVFNSDDEDNPTIVAGLKMYETKKCPLVITERKGTSISFLTTFAFFSEAGAPQFVHKKVGVNGVRRSLRIFDNKSNIEVLFLEGGGLDVQ